MITGGVLGELGYTGSVGLENCLTSECSFEGWNMGDGAAAFLSGEAAGGFIPGATGGLTKEALKTSFAGGALQNGGGYGLGRLFNGELPDLGMTALNAVTGGFAGNLGQGWGAGFEEAFSSPRSIGAMIGKIGSSIFSDSTVVGTQNGFIDYASNDGRRERCQSVGGTADC
jgi:hypothetical protein